ncbi:MULTISPECIES: PQQ-binding-like beta-propeller repeat protein [Halobacterium]|uniref:outer membrane protein assembly factor BamB family protein n=1 Tax=Halobacterium TaxID=2239 RepID=UPI00073E5BD2|nr:MULTISPECIES: PQQ-binding-like beta-propeller repeat protein [Halobacterium]MCG1003648.1 PQQ-like beta-propeller repeat protein [Halobacterium noricense]
MPSLRRRGFLAACAASAAAGCLGSPPEYDPASADTWPMDRYDPGGTNHTPSPGPRTDPSVAWHRDVRSLFDVPTPLVRGDTLYLGTFDRFSAFDAATGERRWQLREDGRWLDGALAAAPAYGDVMPVVATQNGYAAIAPSGGLDVFGFRRAFETRWQRTGVEPDRIDRLLAFSRSSVPPVVADGRVYVVATADESTVAAIDAATGETAWSTTVHRATDARVAVAGGRVFVPTFGEGLVALDASTGEYRWTAPVVETHVYPPTATGSVVYAHDREFVYAFDAASGDELWRGNREDAARRLTDTRTPLTTDGERVYAVGSIDDGTAVVALDADTGDFRWAHAAGTEEVSPVAADGTLYVPDADGVVALDAASGERRWTRGDGRVASLSVVGTTAYAATTGGRLYALEGSA